MIGDIGMVPFLLKFCVINEKELIWVDLRWPADPGRPTELRVDVRGAGRGFVPDLERHRQGTLTPVQRQEQFRCAGKNDVFRSRIPEKPEKENPKTFISTSQLACSSSRFAQARDILLHELITSILQSLPLRCPQTHGQKRRQNVNVCLGDQKEILCLS